MGYYDAQVMMDTLLARYKREGIESQPSSAPQTGVGRLAAQIAQRYKK